MTSNAFLKAAPAHRRAPWRTVGAGLLAVVAACGGGAARGAGGTTDPAATKVFGVVTRTVGKDTVPVAGALVAIRDLRLTVQTDEKGYYEFRAGLVPGEYRVTAEADNEKGATARAVPVIVGQPTVVAIHLGGSATPWPPPLALDTLTAKAAAKTTGKIRP